MDPLRSPETIDFRLVQDNSAELLGAYRAFEQARAAYKAKIKSTATNAHVDAATLHNLISTSANGTFAAYRQKIDRAAILFNHIADNPTP